MYDSLPRFYAAHRPEIDAAVDAAERRAGQWVRGLPPGADTDAFLGEAAAAVWMAALRYRPEIGVPFDKWAALEVEHALRRQARQQDWLGERRRRALRGGSLEALPSDLTPVSLDSIIGLGLEPLDLREPGPEQRVLELFRKDGIQRAILTLPPREAEILIQRYWQGSNLAEIAVRFGVSTARAGQLVQQAQARVRRLLEVEV
jgi:RNA polymerase sigma factor (sigma-70 family)